MLAPPCAPRARPDAALTRAADTCAPSQHAGARARLLRRRACRAASRSVPRQRSARPWCVAAAAAMRARRAAHPARNAAARAAAGARSAPPRAWPGVASAAFVLFATPRPEPRFSPACRSGGARGAAAAAAERQRQRRRRRRRRRRGGRGGGRSKAQRPQARHDSHVRHRRRPPRQRRGAQGRLPHRVRCARRGCDDAALAAAQALADAAPLSRRLLAPQATPLTFPWLTCGATTRRTRPTSCPNRAPAAAARAASVARRLTSAPGRSPCQVQLHGQAPLAVAPELHGQLACAGAQLHVRGVHGGGGALLCGCV